MKIRRATVAEQSVQFLRAQILERKLAPGTTVTEEALARDIGISRPTVREVLNTLTVEGLLTRSPTTRVLHVTRLGSGAIAEIYRARRLLEAGGVTAFAGREDAALAELVAATDRLVATIAAGDERAVVRADIACHVELVALVGSADLTEFYGRLLDKLQLAMADVARSESYDLAALGNDHRRFVALLQGREIEAARRLVIERLDGAERALRAQLTDD